jgi:hydroxymethylbilane synthase
MASPLIILATRGSALALAQANAVLAQCRAVFPNDTFEIKIIKTTGDKLQVASLASANLPKGLFTKELEAALLNREADLAVHSLKDLPTELPPSLILGATPQREDPRDVLILRGSLVAISGLPQNAVVATSSTRRQAFLLEARPDLKIVPIRGNVPTRLKKLAENPEIQALVLAAAGLHRLGYQISPSGGLQGAGVPPDLFATPLSFDEMLPCVGQAAIGLEMRAGDARLSEICSRLNHPDTLQCVLAERALLRALGGGCQIPVAALGQIQGPQLRLRAVSFLDKSARRAEAFGLPSDPETLGRKLAAQLAPRQ